VTLPEPGLPDEAATAEYWKGIAEAAVELAKASVAADLADGTWDRQERADLRKAAEDEYVARRKDETSADLDIHKQVLAAMIEVAKGSIERSRDSAKFVQASAAALATGYTTLLVPSVRWARDRSRVIASPLTGSRTHGLERPGATRRPMRVARYVAGAPRGSR
jgi:hypothetical protein